LAARIGWESAVVTSIYVFFFATLYLLFWEAESVEPGSERQRLREYSRVWESGWADSAALSAARACLLAIGKISSPLLDTMRHLCGPVAATSLTMGNARSCTPSRQSREMF